MRIAVVGSGVSGLVAARILSQEHQVVLFEASDRIGGHVNTVDVELGGKSYAIDTGFIVYNDRTYPNFSRILRQLQVETIPTSMSFSVRCDRTGLEYNGTSLDGVFAQRRNLWSPSFLRMLFDILRFNRQGLDDLNSVRMDQTVGEYLREQGFSDVFARQYLLPMGAAIWSCPCEEFAKFPIRFILEFYANHGLLSLRDRPQWRVIRGGSNTYVERLVEPLRDRIRIDCPVHSITRLPDRVQISHARGEESFDEVVLACHSDQALGLLTDTDARERELLTEFPYSSNSAVLHTDTSLLPRSQRAWASWNYHIGHDPTSRPTLTYNMNMLQQIHAPRTFCVSLNEDRAIDERKIIRRFQYQHPLFTTNRARAQKRHQEVIRYRRTSYCGAYWRNGFHEDGVVSALAVCKRFGIDDWNVRFQPGMTTRRISKPRAEVAV